jgi:hypothetical protein
MRAKLGEGRIGDKGEERERAIIALLVKIAVW